MAKYTIREADDRDIWGISQLRLSIKEYKDLESENYDLFWKSLLRDNPCSVHKALVAVDNGGRVLAHYGIAPFRFLKNGEPLLGGFVCQLMVDADFRHEFIFPKMMLKMLREYRSLGIDFAYSLSSRTEVVKAHQSFGFHKIGDIPVYAKPYRLTKIVPHVVQGRALNIILKPFLAITERFMRIKRTSDKGDITVREIPRFEAPVDNFLATVRNHFNYSILRSSEILNWRTVDSPVRKYRILSAETRGNMTGYVVLRQMRMKQFNVLAIVDIMFSPDQPETGTTLLNAAHNMAIDLNTDMTTCLLNPADPLYPVLKKCRYIKTPESISLFVHEPKGKATGLSEESLGKWHITWLDHDSM